MEFVAETVKQIEGGHDIPETGKYDRAKGIDRNIHQDREENHRNGKMLIGFCRLHRRLLCNLTTRAVPRTAHPSWIGLSLRQFPRLQLFSAPARLLIPVYPGA